MLILIKQNYYYCYYITVLLAFILVCIDFNFLAAQIRELRCRKNCRICVLFWECLEILQHVRQMVPRFKKINKDWGSASFQNGFLPSLMAVHMLFHFCWLKCTHTHKWPVIFTRITGNATAQFYFGLILWRMHVKLNFCSAIKRRGICSKQSFLLPFRLR